MRIIAGKWRGQRIAAPDTTATRPILDRAKTVLFDMLGARLAQPGLLPPIAVLDLFAGSGAMGLEALSRGARYCLFVEQKRATAEIIRRNLETLRILAEADVAQSNATQLHIKPPPPAESPDLKSQISDPQSQISAPGSEISNLKSQMSAPGSEISNLKSQMSGPQSEISNFKSQISDLKSQPRDLQTGTEPLDKHYELIFMDPPYHMLQGPRPANPIMELLRLLADHPLIAPQAVIIVRHAFQPAGGPVLSPLIEQERRDVGNMTFRFMVRPDHPAVVAGSAPGRPSGEAADEPEDAS